MQCVAVGSDHAGYYLKHEIIHLLQGSGYEPLDLGAQDTSPLDYPDIALEVGQAVQEGPAWRGILICGSGVGASVAANKIRGIRAGLCHDTYSAHQGVEHDDMNVLCLGSRIIGLEVAKELVLAFLQAKFSRDERHVRRLNKVRQLDERDVRKI